MRSRQRYEKRKQRFSEGWQQAVLKLPEPITNSTALSPEITKSATLGPTPTKGKYYKDNKEAVQARDAKRMWVNGEEIKKTHPLYKAGRYKGFEDAAFSSLENYKTSPEGQVYIITNPAWEGWVKVGMAVDAEDRLGGYQTSSPYRDYTLVYTVDTPDRRATEAETHNRLADIFEQRNEWFKCDVEIAKRWLDAVIGELDEAC